MRKRNRSTLPAFIENQPSSWYYGDGQKHINETQKNRRNKMRHVLGSEGKPRDPSAQPAPTSKKLIRSKTRTIIYKSVRTINN
jgi:hypothetical protein